MSESILEVGQITLLGTVHASRNSRNEVQAEIAAREPDTVAVELDPRRHTAMRDSPAQSADPLDLTLSILNGDLSMAGAVVNYLFVRHQSKIFSALDLRPGEADMLPAVDTAHDIGAQAALVDSEIDGVMDGLGESLTPNEIASNLLGTDLISLISSYATLKRITERNGLTEFESVEDAIGALETMPYEDLERLVESYETLLPDGTLDAILHARNEVMAGHLYWLQQHDASVVAVMGRLHVPGVRDLLENPDEIPDEYIVEPPYVTEPSA